MADLRLQVIIAAKMGAVEGRRWVGLLRRTARIWGLWVSIARAVKRRVVVLYPDDWEDTKLDEEDVFIPTISGSTESS